MKMGAHKPGRSNAPPLPEPDSAWFLDIDGTLLEIAETPDLVRADATVIELVRRLADASVGALALISGRPVTTVDRLFAPLKLPIAGQHGVERRSASGVIQHHAASKCLESIRGRVHEWAGERPGLLVEDKGLTLAVHFRRAPQYKEELEQCLREMVAECDGFGLEPGKMVFEVKPTGKDKGTAVAEFMAEHPFRGRRPIFVGDDVTDEYAIAAVKLMGGMTVKVGDGTSVADWRLRDVAAVRDWIAAWLEQYGVAN